MLVVSLAGFIVGLARWRRLERGQRFAASWLAAGALFTLAALVAGHLMGSSLVTTKLWYLVSIVLAGETLVSYERSRRRVTLMRTVILAYMLIWVVCLLSVEDLAGYSVYLSPLHSLVILGMASVVLVRLSVTRHELLLLPGFLIAAGLVAYAAPSAFQGPVVQLLVKEHPDAALAYYIARDVVATLATLLIARALLLQPVVRGRVTI